MVAQVTAVSHTTLAPVEGVALGRSSPVLLPASPKGSRNFPERSRRPRAEDSLFLWEP